MGVAPAAVGVGMGDEPAQGAVHGGTMRDGVEPVSAFLRSQNVIGFNTYGEQFNGMHINQTFTGVAIGRPGRG